MDPVRSSNTSSETGLLTVLIALDKGIIRHEQLHDALAQLYHSAPAQFYASNPGDIPDPIGALTLESLLGQQLTSEDCRRMQACREQARQILGLQAQDADAELPPAMHQAATQEITLLPYEDAPPKLTSQNFISQPATNGMSPEGIAALENGVPYMELENEPEAAPVDDTSWQETSEFWSHIYYVDDIIRSYTAGWLGLVSVGLLFLACVSITMFAPSFFADPSVPVAEQFEQKPSSSTQQRDAKTKTLPEAQPESQLTQRDSNASANTDRRKFDQENSTNEGETAAAAFTRDPKPKTQTNSVSPITTPFTTQAESPRDRKDTKTSANADASPPKPNSDKKSTPVATSAPIDRRAELDAFLTFTRAGNFAEAKRVISTLRVRSGNTDPMIHQLLFCTLLEQGTQASIQEAGEMLALLDIDDDPNSQSLMIRWMTLLNREQRNAFYQQFKSEDEAGLATLCLSTMCGDHQTALKQLRTRIAAGENSLPNHFFLAIAEYYSGNRQNALKQLEQSERLLASNSTGDASAIEAWLSQSNQKAIGQGVEKLRGRLKIPN